MKQSKRREEKKETRRLLCIDTQVPSTPDPSLVHVCFPSFVLSDLQSLPSQVSRITAHETYINIFFLFKQYSTIWTLHNLFIYSLAARYLSCLHFLAINNAAIHIHIYIFMWVCIFISPRLIAMGGTAGSYWKYRFQFMRC